MPNAGFTMSLFWHVVIGLHVAGVGLAFVGLHRAGLIPRIRQTGGTWASPREGSSQRRLSPRERSLLGEDELVLFELVEGRGAQVYQKDLPELTGFSKAKVSRLLDKLERKGLVQRLSHGMTNRVVLAPDPPP